MRSAQSARFITAALLSAAFALGACGKDKDGRESLPPARGPGAPPDPTLPKIEHPAQTVNNHATTSDETTGTTFPHAEAKLAPNMSGVIAKISVDEGSKIKKGQVVFRLRTTDIALRVKQAKAALATAEVNLRAIKVEYDRTKRLFEQNAINAATWDKVKAQYDAALAGVEQAKVGVAMGRQALADAYVKSPISGVVTMKLANEGEMVTMMPPKIVVVVEDHSVLDLKFQLPERALTSLAPGDAIKAVFTAVGVTRTAKIKRVNPRVDPRTRTVEVVAELDNEGLTLKPGMLAKIEMLDKSEATSGEPEPEKAAKGAGKKPAQKRGKEASK